MKNAMILIFVILTSLQIGHSCNFPWVTFCETFNSDHQDLVVSGQITGTDEYGIDLEILTVMQGQEERTSIRIWDGTDFDCNGIHPMDAALLGDIGDTIIIILPRIDSLENNWEVIGDYRMPFPYGENPFLFVENNMVLYKSGFKIKYQSFIENLCDSDHWEVIVNSIEVEEKQFSLYPNPVSDYCIIELPTSTDKTELSIFDLSGKKVLMKHLDSSKSHVDINKLSTGTYFAIISKRGNIIARERIIKF